MPLQQSPPQLFAIIVDGIAPILSVTVTSMLLSTFSGAIGAIAYPAQGYGVNAGLTSAAPPGQPQDESHGKKNSGVSKK